MTETTTPLTESPTGAVGRNFNPFSTKASHAPFDLWTRYRNEAPVVRSEELGGFYLLSRFADVWAATLDTTTYISGEGTTVPKHPVRMPPEDTDGAEHRLYRKIVDPHFSPKAIRAAEPWVREIIVELFDAIADPTRFDFVREFSTLVPKRVILRMLGVPDEDLPELIDPITVLNGAYDDPEAGAAAGAQLYGYFAKMIEQRRAQPGADDLLSALLSADFDGRPLEDIEMQHMMILILLGGTDTSSGAMGGMMLWLADHPEDLARLRAQPELIPSAIDEFLRYVSPVAYMARTLSADAEVHGCPMRQGEKVLLGFGPANRDPEKFDRPDEVILDRRPNPHVAFGAGPHRCLGAHLVTLEMTIVLEQVLARFESFEVEDYTQLRFQKGQARNLQSLPLRARVCDSTPD